MRHAFPAVLFILAFLPRAIQPVSRPLVWYLRSAHFMDAVLAGDWANTVYSEHPGVTLMWPVGIGLKLYWMLSGITPAAESVAPDFEPIHFFGPVPVAEIAAALLPLALLISFGIVVIYFLLRRLFDGTTAAVAATLLALSPYYLAQSKILHLDAWMATLMLASALALLLYCRERNIGWLALAAVLGGLALLVKPTALFLVPFCGLVLLVHTIRDTYYAIRDPHHASLITYHLLRSLLVRLILPLVAWLFIAALVYFILWPAMWVDPERALKAVVEGGLLRHTTTPHDAPSFFAGRVTTEDPGFSFYIESLLFRASDVEASFCIVAIGVGGVCLIRGPRTDRTVTWVLLIAYAVLYLIQMNLGEKKIERYVLPALLALDVVAAAGIVAWARVLARRRRALTAILMMLPLLIQALLVLPRHPYYGTTFSWLFGGPQAAARTILVGEEGEGLAELAASLNARPEPDQIVVAAQLKHVFNQYFEGDAVDIDAAQSSDYLIFHHNYTVRDYKIKSWGALWERYAARTPEEEICFDGVPYAWLYPTLPSDALPEHRLEARIGSSFGFLGYDLRSMEVAPGDRVSLVLYWQTEEPVPDDLSIFLHLLASDGSLIWQEDGAANHGARPTYSWNAGEIIADPHTVALPHDLPPGSYQLVAGLYDWQTGERLPVSMLEGERLADDQITVATLAVRRPATHPAAWGARVLAGLVMVSALVTVWRSGTDE